MSNRDQNSLKTDNPIVQGFQTLVAADPTAGVATDGMHWCRRAQLSSASHVVASRLRDNNIEQGDLVAVACANGPAFLAALLAVWEVGAVAVLVDAGVTGLELERVSQALGATHSVTAGSGWRLDAALWQIQQIAGVQPARFPGAAVVKLSSGSTGEPRGIVVTADALLADSLRLRDAFGFTADDRFLCTLPLSHSYGLSVLAIPALAIGTPLVVPDRALPLTAAAHGGATIFPTVPSYLRALLKPSNPAPWPQTLRHVITAGEVLPAALSVQFEDVYGLRPHVFYGASECGGISYDIDGTAARRGSVGTLLPGVEIELGDAADSTSSAGRPLTVRSDAVATCYHPTPEPDVLAGGCFASDDLVAVQDRELSLKGRRSGWINVRGRKVSPREVEDVLAELDGVEEAVVVGRPTAHDGVSVRAFLVADEKQHSYMEIVDWCRPRLAPYKIPRAVTFVDSLPRTERGKIDRRALEELS